MAIIRDALIKWLEGQAALPVETQAFLANKRYDYLVDLDALRSTVAELMDLIRSEDGKDLSGVLKLAYEAGTTDAAKDFSRLIDEDGRTITQVLSSEPYLRRTAYVGARAFEEMDGFAGEAGAELGRTLLAAMQEGESIDQIKRKLFGQFDVAKFRAERIARTEITGALRRGRVDEAQETEAKFGVTIGMLWFSALSSTTRKTHAALHGKVLTPEEVKEFYSRNANGINCKCSQVTVIMGPDGKPMQQSLIDKEAARRSAYFKKQEEGQ